MRHGADLLVHVGTREAYLESGFALQAGVDQQVALPGHGQVKDGQR